MDNPWEMNFVKFNVNLLANELHNWAIYFDKEVKLINSITLTKEDNKHILFVNTPAVEFTISVNYDCNNGETYYSLTFDSFEYTVRCSEIDKDHYLCFVKLFKKIIKLKEKKKEMFATNRSEMLGKIVSLVVKQKGLKK